jgi:phosphate-selective porin OprO/OprP
MRKGLWNFFGKCVAGGVLGTLLAAGGANAQDGGELADLKRRLEALEQQNQKLQKIIEQELPAPPPTSAGAVLPAAAEPSNIDKAVLDGIKKYEADRKKAEDEAKAKKEKEGYVVGEDFKLSAKWDNGFWAETQDKAFRIHIGGRTQFDTIWYNVGNDVQYGNNGVGRVDDGVAFRRARFAMEGTCWEVVDFNFEYDFLNTDTLAQNVALTRNAAGVVTNVNRVGRILDTPVPTDLWVQLTHIPVIGNIRIGNQKAPFSFEHLTSSRFLNFLERSYAFDAYVGGPQNGFEPGIQAFNNFADDRIHVAASLTKPNMTIFGFNTGDGEWAFTGRVGAFPVWEDDGRVAVWIGCGYRHSDPDFLVTGNRQFSGQTLGQVRLRARTELRNGPAELHTPLLDIFPFCESQDLLIPEFAAVCGPWSIVAEYFGNWLTGARSTPTSPSVGTHFTQSAYVEALYFLTGEHRVFNRKTPGFTRVTPKENYFLTKGDCGNILGRGAWQVGARYSWIDLADKNLLAGNNTIGNAQAVTLGLNWFLNPNMKLQWNYTYEMRYGVNTVPAGSPNAGLFPGQPSDGSLRGFGMRMAFDY